jgi:hypothetical protein
LSLIVQANVARPSIDAKLWDARRNPRYMTLFLTGALGIHGYREQAPLNIDRSLALALAHLLLCDERSWETLRMEHCSGHLDILIGVALMHGRIQQISFSEVTFDVPMLNSLSTGLKFNTSVHDLFLRSCALNGVQVSALGNGLEGNTSLRSVTLEKCELTDELLSELVHALSQCPRLQRLNLEGNHCRDLGIQALCALVERSEAFLSLGLHNQHVPDDNEDILNVLPLIQTLSNPACSLRYLDLSRNSLRDEHVSGLVEAFSLERSQSPPGQPTRINMTLETLHLDQNLITNSGAEIIAQAFTNFRALKVATLSENPFTDTGASALAHAMESSSLSLETVIIPSGLSEVQKRIRWYGNLNKGGRSMFAFLPEGQVKRLRPLFPLIFQRINRTRLSHDWNPVTAPADVIFYALQRVGHDLLSESPPSPTPSSTGSDTADG